MDNIPSTPNSSTASNPSTPVENTFSNTKLTRSNTSKTVAFAMRNKHRQKMADFPPIPRATTLPYPQEASDPHQILNYDSTCPNPNKLDHITFSPNNVPPCSTNFIQHQLPPLKINSNISNPSLEAFSPTTCPISHPVPEMSGSLSCSSARHPVTHPSPRYNQRTTIAAGLVSSIRTAESVSPVSPSHTTHTRDYRKDSISSDSSPVDGLGIANYDPWKHTRSPSPTNDKYFPADPHIPVAGTALFFQHIQYQPSISRSGTINTARSSSIQSNCSSETSDTSYFSPTHLNGSSMHQNTHNNNCKNNYAYDFNNSSAPIPSKPPKLPPKLPPKIPLDMETEPTLDTCTPSLPEGYLADQDHDYGTWRPSLSSSHNSYIPTNGPVYSNTNPLMTPLGHSQNVVQASYPPVSTNGNNSVANATTQQRQTVDSITKFQSLQNNSFENDYSIPARIGGSARNPRPFSFEISDDDDNQDDFTSTNNRQSAVSLSDPISPCATIESVPSDLARKMQAPTTPTLSETTTNHSLPSTTSDITSITQFDRTTAEKKARSGDWHIFWDIPLEDIENGVYNKHDVKFQSELHSFIHNEINFVHDMKRFLSVFNNQTELARILEPNHLEALNKKLFEPTAALIEVNETYLLSPFLQQRNDRTKISPRTNETFMLDFLVEDVLEWLDVVVEPFFAWAVFQSEIDSFTKSLMSNTEFERFVNQGNEITLKECHKREFKVLKNFPRNRYFQYGLHFGELKGHLEKKQKEMIHNATLSPEERDVALVGAVDPEPLIQSIHVCIDNLRAILKKFNDLMAVETNKTKMDELERKLEFKHEEHKMAMHLRYNPQEPHILHELVAEKEIYRKKGSWESNFSALLLDHMLLFVRKERDIWHIVERPIHLELIRIEAVPDPEYKSAIYNTINRSAPQSSRSSVSHNQFPQRPSITTLSSQEGASISPIGPSSLPMPPSLNPNSVARSLSLGKSSEDSTESLSDPANVSPLHVSADQRRPSNISVASSVGARSDSSAPTTPVTTRPLSSSFSSSTNLKSLTSISHSNSTTPSGNAMMKDFSNNSQAGLVYPLKLINLEHNEKSWIAFDRLQDRQNFLDLLQSTRRKYHDTRYEQNKVPIGLKVLDIGAFPSSEHRNHSYFDTDVGDAVDRAMSSYDVPLVWPPKKSFIKTSGDISCSLDIVFENSHFTFLGTTNGVYGAIHPKGLDGGVATNSYELSWKLVAQLPRVTHLEANVENQVLLILSGSELKFSRLPEIQSLLFTTTTVAMTPPQDIYNSVRCFRTGTLGDDTYLFYSKLSKVQETGFATTVTVYKIAPSQNKEKPTKGIGRLLKGNGANKPYSSFLQKPNLISSDLFSPSKVVGFSFFDSFFFFHTPEEFCYMPIPIDSPQGIPTMSTMPDILKRYSFPPTEFAFLKEDLSKARPIAVARMSRLRHDPPSSTFSLSADASAKLAKFDAETQPTMIHCYHKFAIMSVKKGNLYIPSAQRVNGTMCRMPYKLPYLHKIQSAYLLWPYLLLFSTNTVEVRLLTARNFNQSLVQVITGRNIRLLTGRAFHSASSTASAGNNNMTNEYDSSKTEDNQNSSSMHSSSSQPFNQYPFAFDSHSGETDKIIISMEHPDPAISASVIFELFKIPGVVANDVSLKSSLYDLDSKKSRKNHT